MEKQKEQTITYGVGRFVIDIPASMQYRGSSYRMIDRSIKEIIWSDANNNTEAENIWNANLEKIKELKAPNGYESALIEVKDIEHIGKSCKAVLFFNEPLDTEYGSLHMFLNSGFTGVWIKARDKKLAAKDVIYEIATDLAKAYRPPVHRLGKAGVLTNVDSFYMKYGAIDLPFEYEESVEISFYGHKLDENIELDIETDVVGEVEKAGLMDKLNAMIMTNYAPGLKIDKLRTQKRTVAGMKGEEIVFRGTEKDGNDKGLYFKFSFPGEENNAHFPSVTIDMQAEDGGLEEKLALWDAILDGMRPAGR